MSKRGAESQGRKETGFEDENQRGIDEPVKRATAAQMAGRTILNVKSRKRAGGFPSSGSPSPSPFQPQTQSLGNPFGGFQSNTSTTNGSASPSPDLSKQSSNPGFNQSGFNQSGFNFGASQSFPATNGANSNSNGQAFGFGASAPSNNSFPPANNGNGNLFANLSGSSNGFTFGANMNIATQNPFAKAAQPQSSNPTQPSNVFGTQPSSGFQGFGQQTNNTTNGVSAHQTNEPTQGTSGGNEMQISPPTTPSKGLTSNGNVTANATNIFGQPLNPASSKTASTPTSLFPSTSAAPSNPFAKLPPPSAFQPQPRSQKATKPVEQPITNSVLNMFGNPAPATPKPASSGAGSAPSPFGGFSVKGAGSNPSLASAESQNTFTQDQASFTNSPAVNAQASTNSADPADAKKSTPSTQRRLHALNQGYRNAVASMSSKLDWSTMAEAYLSELSKIRDSVSSTTSGDLSSSAFGKRKAPSDAAMDKKRARPSEQTAGASTFTPSRSQTSNLFQSIVDGGSAQTSAPAAPSTPTNMFAPSKQAPATAPPANLFGNKLGQSETPQNKTNMFAPSTVAQPKSTFGQGASFGSQPTAASTSTKFGKPAVDGLSSNVFGSGNTGTPRSNMFGNIAGSKMTSSDLFAPKQSSAPAATTDDSNTFGSTNKKNDAEPKKDGASGFQVPKFGAGANVSNMLSQFAQKTAETAKAMQAENKKRKKDDEFDSDDSDDNEEEWEKKYAEEQAAKKQKLVEAPQAVFVPGQGFVFKRTDSAVNSASESGNVSDSGNVTGDESDQAATSNAPSKTPSQTFGKTSNASNIFGHLSQSQSPASQKAGKGEDDESDEDDNLEEEMHRKSQKEASGHKSGTSLFDRVTPASPQKAGGSQKNQISIDGPSQSLFSGTQSTFGQSSTFGSNIFGNTQTSPGDHTWKKDEPIKFGASVSGVNGVKALGEAASSSPSKANGLSTPAPKAFAGLFGTGKADPTPSLFSKNLGSTTPSGSPAKALSETMGFGFTPKLAAPSTSLFSSTVTSDSPSRASTPGTDGNNTSDANSGDEEAALDQSDLTSLSAEEIKKENVLYEVPKAKVLQFGKVDGSEKSQWKTLGTGPLRVLKNKETGLVRILMRIAPSGKLLMNAPLLKSVTYKKAQKGVVQFGAPDMEGNFKTWYARMAKDEVAAKLAEVCEANKGS